MSGGHDAHGGHDDHHAAPSGGGGGGGGIELGGPAKGLAGVAAATGVTAVGGLVCSLFHAIFSRG